MTRAIFTSAVGATLSLLSVGFLRLGPDGAALPLVVGVFAAWAAFQLASAGFRSPVGDRSGTGFRHVMAFLLVPFWTWHLWAAMRSADLAPAILEHAKLSAGMVTFLIICLAGSTLGGRQDRIWSIHIWGMSFLLLALAYRYAVVFGMPYLGIDWNDPTRLGKNQLGWFMAASMPYVVSYAMSRRHRVWVALPLLVHLAAWVYTASRGSWLCGLLGCAVACHALGRRCDWKRPLKGALIGVLGLVAVLYVVGGPVVSSSTIQDLDVYSRIAGVANGRANSYSDMVRSRMMDRHLALLDEQPVFGNGLRSGIRSDGLVSHNDYLTLFADLGALGVLFFGLVVWGVGRHQLRVGVQNWFDAGARGSLLAIVSYGALINVYTSPMFWVMLGFAALAGSHRSIAGLRPGRS